MSRARFRSWRAVRWSCSNNGFQVQTNSVSVDGTLGALMSVRKTGGVSTLAVIDGVKKALPEIERLIPRGVEIKPIFDQSVFVKAALDSVLMGGLMAAALTALMILLFLGDWRLTLIILAAIPLSIVTRAPAGLLAIRVSAPRETTQIPPQRGYRLIPPVDKARTLRRGDQARGFQGFQTGRLRA